MMVASPRSPQHVDHVTTAAGTVSLVALCFIAVLGIVLASYIAVCSRAMNLSNRSFQSRLSQQLAEFGLEEGLRAFNKNDWSGWTSGGMSVSWDTLTNAANKRAVATITFPATKLGQGATATIKIRIDNFDAANLDSTWNNTTNYRINDLVGSGGAWFRCVQNNSGQSPHSTPWANMAYWVPTPLPWTWSSNVTYAQDDIVNYNGTWYRYINASAASGFVPTNITYWISTSNSFKPWSAATTYSQNTFAYNTSNNQWYRYINASSSSGNGLGNATYWSDASSGTPTLPWVYNSGVTYSYDDIVYDNSGHTWYRYINAAPTSGNAPAPGSYWEYARSGNMWGWSNAGLKYNIGNVVYYSTTTQWYRCILAHTSSASITPSNTTYWSNAPLYSTAWDSGPQYSANDTVSYNGVWYRCLVANNNSNPAANATNWGSAANSTYFWSSAATYTTSSYVSYGGVWYKCSTVPTAGQSPNNSTYWTPTWANSAGINTGAPVIYAEASITLPNNPPARTQLRAAINPASLFPNAAAGTANLTINAATGTVDSYDSTAGSNYAAQVGTATNYSAVLAAGTTLAINDTTAVKGYLAWPSPAGGISTNTTVWGISSPTSPKLDPAQISRSPYIPQFDIQPSGGLLAGWSTVPKGTALPAAATVNIGSPGATTPSRYYYNGNLVIGGGSSIIATLNINGPVIIYINGDLTMTGTSPTGIMNINSAGSAEIHVGGILKVDSGSDGIVNKTLDPHALILLCDNAASTIPFYSEGVNPLYGVIYAPKTTATGGLTFNYSNTNTTTLYGAVSAANVTFNNNAIVHYDTSLRSATFGGVDQPYAVTEWRNLPVTEQATIP